MDRPRPSQLNVSFYSANAQRVRELALKLGKAPHAVAREAMLCGLPLLERAVVEHARALVALTDEEEGV